MIRWMRNESKKEQDKRSREGEREKEPRNEWIIDGRSEKSHAPFCSLCARLRLDWTGRKIDCAHKHTHTGAFNAYEMACRQRYYLYFAKCNGENKSAMQTNVENGKSETTAEKMLIIEIKKIPNIKWRAEKKNVCSNDFFLIFDGTNAFDGQIDSNVRLCLEKMMNDSYRSEGLCLLAPLIASFQMNIWYTIYFLMKITSRNELRIFGYVRHAYCVWMCLGNSFYWELVPIILIHIDIFNTNTRFHQTLCCCFGEYSTFVHAIWAN